MKQYSRAFQHAAEKPKGDREFVMEAVKQSGWALQDAAEELKVDRGIVHGGCEAERPCA